eukprot:scaffold5163_cov49-Cyclotella_meneghiniana.AAC.3
MSTTPCYPVRQNIVQQNQPQNSIPTDDDDSSINSIAGSIQSPPKGSVLDHIDRPISPTSIESFPYFEVKHSEITQASVELEIHATNNRRFPTLITNKAEIQATVNSLEYQDTSANNYDIEDCSIVEEYTVIADLGTYYKTFVINTASPTSNSTLADTGANCSMTANINILKNVRKLDTPIIVGTAVTNSGDVQSAECKYIGDLPIQCDDGDIIYTTCFYNENASDTIISPQSIVDESPSFICWEQRGKKLGQPGMLIFKSKDTEKVITLQQQNGLYYCNTRSYPIIRNDSIPPCVPQLHKAVNSSTQTSEVRPKRLPKPTNKYTPTSKAKILQSETWNLRMGCCSESSLESLCQHAIGIPTKLEWHPYRFVDFKEHAKIGKQPVGKDPVKVNKRGQRFYFDFGFIRASNNDFSRPTKTKDRIVESYDGYNSYLLIVDEISKYCWIFLTKSKEPPIELTKLFLRQYGHKDGGKIRCDQGGELARSEQWRSMLLDDHQYYVEPTGADSPSQNGQVENYNKTLGTVVRTLLYGANLPAKYWSAAATHAVYLMNRRFHSTIKRTPYEAWWDEQPDLSKLKVFGSRVCVKVTGKRNAKLDRHDFNGIFIGYTATDDNIKYIDTSSGVTKSSHHAVFDEAWYLQAKRPPMAQLLYDLGMEDESELEQIKPEQSPITTPYPPMPTGTIPTLPKEAKMQHFPLRLSEPPPHKETTARAATLIKTFEDYKSDDADGLPNRISRLDIIKDMQLDKDEVFNQVYLSPSPFHEAFQEKLDLRQWNPKNDHKAAGLSLIKDGDRLILGNIIKSTPAARIDKWRSRCRGAWLMEIDGTPVTNQSQVHDILQRANEQGKRECPILLAHPEIKAGLTSMGIPQLHIDQMNPKYILNLDHIMKQDANKIADGGVWNWSFSKLTRGKLIRQNDWNEWQQSEWKQLDQYYEQGMFGKPTEVLDRSQVFHLVWTYNIKDVDKRKKARCACDGSTRGGKARVLDYTHANCIEHTASRLFYAISAAENMLIFGADVCNAFSEAPPPKQGFYIQPDRAFREWWTARGFPPMSDTAVIPVMRAMQGHPESSRLWERHMDKIVRKFNFKPTKHEPCLYEGYIDGERCIFKRQVDDFALATDKEETAHKFFDMIDDELTMPMKRMGLIQLFNGIDIQQSRHYIKLSCQTYIEKFCEKHLQEWMNDAQLRDMSNRPLPIPTHESFTKNFHNIPGDPNEKAQELLKKEFKFGYRSGIGELIYAMVTCRPDISTAVVQCAQHSVCPSKYHYHAVRHAIKYLYITRKDGIYFWRPTPRLDLPDHPLPPSNVAYHGPVPEQATRPTHGPMEPHCYTDSNWANCMRTRRSTTGVNLQVAGGSVGYKTRLQPTVALSSTEAEFMAACEAGKMLLYIRSILWDLGVPQQAASIIYEDNDACTAMANAQKPTSRTRHMDIRYFALSDWVEQDLMTLERIHTSVNIADHFTKPLERTLFYRHVDYIMGHIPPAYSPCYTYATGNAEVQPTSDVDLQDMVVKPPVARAAKCELQLQHWFHIVACTKAHVQSNLYIPHWIVGGC